MEKHTTTAKSKITRRNYSRISGSLELPNLVEIQTNSYKWFKEVGIKEVFDDIYPITNFNETLSLEFVDCAFDEPKSTPSGTMHAQRPLILSIFKNKIKKSNSVFLVLQTFNKSADTES